MTFFSAPWAVFHHENSWLVAGFTTSFSRYDTQPFTLPSASSGSLLFSYRCWSSVFATLFVIQPSFLLEKPSTLRVAMSSRPPRPKGQLFVKGNGKRTGQGKLILNAEVGHLVYFFINFPPMDPRVTPSIRSYVRVFSKSPLRGL